MGKRDDAKWFRNYATDEAIISNASPEQVGAAFQAVMQYFVFGEPEHNTAVYLNDPVVRLLYSMFKRRADESLEEYAKKAEGGRKGALMKQKKAAEQERILDRHGQQSGVDWLESLGNIPP